MCKIIHYPLTSCLLITNVLLSILFCSTLALFLCHSCTPSAFVVCHIYLRRTSCCAFPVLWSSGAKSFSDTTNDKNSFALFYCVRFIYNIESLLFPTVVFLRTTIKTETCRREMWCKLIRGARKILTECDGIKKFVQMYIN